MKIAILMPMYKSMDASCVQSLVGFQSELHEQGHQVKFIFTNGFNAAKARKALAKGVAEDYQDCDYVLWLDTDHFYRKDAFFLLVNRMEENNLSMLSATYKLHGSEESAHGITDETGFHHFHYKDYTSELIECDVVGFGFLVMKPKLIKELWDEFGDKLFVLDAKENCTEDVTFCRYAKQNGYKVMFDPTVRVGHVELAIRI
jgi:GT2 family glycosyltransferase